MDINAINNVTTAAAAQTSSTRKTAESEANTTQSKTQNKTSSDTGVIYEKSNDTGRTVNKRTYDPAVVAKLKSDAEQRTSQLRSLVEQMMKKQGAAIGNADSMWRFLAGGNFTVDAATKTQAQADIAEDGYWGVEQTSDRILDFAKALSGDNPEKADLLLDAFKKGFEQATKSWGKKLPDISQRTYDAVVEKFDNWKKGSAETTEAEA